MKNPMVDVVVHRNSPVQHVAMIHVIHLHVSTVVGAFESKTINSIVNAEIKIEEFIVNVSDSIGNRIARSIQECISEVECFPSDATVDVQDVGKVRLSALKLGEHVRVIDEKNQIIYSPIIAFLHRDLNEHTTY